MVLFTLKFSNHDCDFFFQRAELLQYMQALDQAIRKKKRVQMRERAAEHQKKMGKIEASKSTQRKKREKEAYRIQGKKQARMEKKFKD